MLEKMLLMYVQYATMPKALWKLKLTITNNKKSVERNYDFYTFFAKKLPLVRICFFVMIEKTLERVLATFLNMERRWFYGKERFFNFISPWRIILFLLLILIEIIKIAPSVLG